MQYQQDRQTLVARPIFQVFYEGQPSRPGKLQSIPQHQEVLAPQIGYASVCFPLCRDHQMDPVKY